MADGLSTQVPPSNRIFVRGAPADCDAGALKELFAKYGAIDTCYFVEGRGCGYVDFQASASAEKAAADTGLAVQGRQLEVKRALPPLAGGPDVGLAPRPLVEPATAQALDVVVVRGHCTAAGIGVTALCARAKSTVLVLWEHHHRPEMEPAVAGALQKRVYNIMEEEMADAHVMGKAFEYFGAGAPKCALLHLGSDKLKQSVEMERPLWQVDEVVQGIEDNHTETLQVFYAHSIYQPWIHAVRACVFVLLPQMMGWDWSNDLCTASISSRRVCKAEPLRTYDGSGWTIGLQLTSDTTAVNARLAYSAMATCVLSDEGMRHQYSGKVMELNMPQADLWFRGQGPA